MVRRGATLFGTPAPGVRVAPEGRLLEEILECLTPLSGGLELKGIVLRRPLTVRPCVRRSPEGYPRGFRAIVLAVSDDEGLGGPGERRDHRRIESRNARLLEKAQGVPEVDVVTVGERLRGRESLRDLLALALIDLRKGQAEGLH